MKQYIYITAVICTILLCGCSDKYNFEGTDNALLSLSLQASDGNTYHGIIGADNIVKIELGDEIDLNNSKVDYDISYKATILPDPQKVTDWNNDQVFNITSRNGQSKTYIVKIIRTKVNYDGDIILRNDNEVAEFANKKITEIKGDLIIGSESGDEKIKNIDALTYLRKVRHAIIINQGYAGKDLSGLRNIVEAGKLIVENDSVTDIILKNLKEIRQVLSIRSQSLAKFSLPKLTTIEQDWSISANRLTNLDFPKLKKSGGFKIESKGLSIIEFKELEEVSNHVNLQNADNLFKISFPKLHSVKGNLVIKQNKVLQNAKLDNLESVKGDFEISSTAISALTLTKLHEVGGDFNIANNSLMRTLATKELKAIGGYMTLSALPLKTLDNLSVQSAKKMTFTNLTSLESISPFLLQVKSIQGDLTLEYINSTEKLDLRNIDFSYQQNNNKTYGKLYLKNSPKIPEVQLPENVGITVSGDASLEQEVPTVIEGGGKVDNIEYRLKAKNNEKLVLKGFTEITQLIVSSNIKIIEAPDLEEGIIMIQNSTNFSGLHMPALKKIHRLTMDAGWNTHNTTLSNLDFLKEVLVEKLFIRNFQELKDFNGLKKSIETKTLGKSNYNVSGCAYTPKYDDLLNGRFTQQ